MNSSSRKILINSPKTMALKFNMYGMLLTKNYTIEDNHVHFRNINKVRNDVQRVQGAMVDLRVLGACGITRRRERPCYTTERQPSYGTIGQKNISRLNQLAAQFGLT